MLARGMVRQRAGRFSAEKLQATRGKINEWVRLLSSKSTTPEGKTHSGQAATLVSFFAKPLPATTPEPDWTDWRQRISTPGLVERIESNFHSLSQEDYEIDQLARKVQESATPEFSRLSAHLTYHRALWKTMYDDHMLTLTHMKFFSGFHHLTNSEWFDRFPGLETYTSKLVETFDEFEGATDDFNYAAYLLNQFVWGRVVISFYRHPSMDFRCLRATNAKMGR